MNVYFFLFLFIYGYYSFNNHGFFFFFWLQIDEQYRITDMVPMMTTTNIPYGPLTIHNEIFQF